MRHVFGHHLARPAALLVITVAALSPAAATVRFGNNVFIGGHDFSNQTYDRHHRAVIHLHAGRPRHPGCVWHAEPQGGQVKVCHLRRIR